MTASLAYEHLVQQLTTALLNAEVALLAPPRVQHNRKVHGRSRCMHQIDVYWEVTLGGVPVRMAIECKHYRHPVELGQVRDFYGVLADTGMHGIIVTTRGYQRGAKLFADHYGIQLLVLETPNE